MWAQATCSQTEAGRDSADGHAARPSWPPLHRGSWVQDLAAARPATLSFCIWKRVVTLLRVKLPLLRWTGQADLSGHLTTAAGARVRVAVPEKEGSLGGAWTVSDTFPERGEK